jgi:hypothetical protein
MKAIKIIKKYYKIRMNDPELIRCAILFYKGLNTNEKTQMIKEYQDYIRGVEEGSIIPIVPSLPEVPKYKIN